MRLRSVLMLGAGYLLGTKAGRERYQEITKNLREVVSSDTTRQVVEKARATLGLAPTDGTAETTASQAAQSGDRPDGWEEAEGGALVPEGADVESGEKGSDA